MRFRFRKVLTIFFIILIVWGAFSSYKWIGKTLYPIRYKEYIANYSKQYDIDPFLVAAIIRVESKFNKDALSHKGAKGLMQIAPVTGRWAAGELGIIDYEESLLYNPEINIKIGCWYINRLKSQFDNNLELILAAYNGGSGNVAKWLNNNNYSEDGKSLKHIPFKETELYLKKVLKSYDIYRKLYKIDYFI
ncbi:lytic transglycosylase domain-containing protein [Proteiniborus sp. DW1]|uniref:lytic transglycosylase domain-containing protein n=1 Tax=Proteiniborus sp. DW1 TaxID=1889883 RepID=UPI0009FAB0BD|nr:lytic transglycosylase domain-containing protein [Proteiniborus sp. DW1]